MKLVILAGTVPADSILPKFSDLFPSIIRPDKVTVYDGFTKSTPAVLGGSVTDVGEKQWLQAGTNPTIVPDSDGGYVESVSTTVTLDSGLANCEIYLKIRLTASASTVGTRFRFASSTNTWQAVIWPASNSVTVTRIVDGTATVVATYPIIIIPSKVYELKIRLSGSNITTICDGVTLGTVEDAAHSSNTRHGLFAGGAGYRWMEFAVGAL